MPLLKDHIENALNETRMLLLGGQVIVGFSFRIYFEPRFSQLPMSAQWVQTIGLILLTAALGWLVLPAAYHQIALRGRETHRIQTFTTTVLDWALLPFVVGTGCSLYPVAVGMHVPHAGLISVAASIVALGLWHGISLPHFSRGQRESARGHSQKEEDEHQKKGDTQLSERIKKVLIECRMALPGAQAMLGMQFINVFTESFGTLPRSLQWIHFASLLCTLLATMLLIGPAAYHRIAEAGKDTERFHTVASRYLLFALVFLAPGMAGDVAVIVGKVADSVKAGVATASALLLLFYALWFGVSFWSRTQHA